jgi:Tfp pilus assembly protein PilN
MGEVVGLGLRQISGCPIEVNLLPKSLRSRKQMESKQPYFIGAAACLMLVPLCFLIYTKQTIKLNERDLKTVSDQVENLERYHRDIQREQSQLNEVKSKADQIVSVIGTRTIWVSLLNDLNGRIVPDMWVTGIAPIGEDANQPTTTPVSTGRGGRVRSSMEEPPPVSESGESKPKTFQALEIRGAGVHSFDNPRQDLDHVDRFAKNLRESPLLDPNGVEIVVPPNPMSREPEFTFVIHVKLKNPLPF